jgi:hypothetical protein
MKDTEENRELQAELNDAVNSQLKKGYNHRTLELELTYSSNSNIFIGNRK